VSEAVYRGPDRRRSAPSSRSLIPVKWPVLALVGAASLAVLGETALRGVGLAGGLKPVADSLGVLATALFFGAGMLRYARWRVTGEAYMAANSASLLVFALAAFPLAVATRAIHTATPVNALASLSRLVAAIAVALILVPALRAAQVDSRLRPRRLAGYGLAAVVAAFAPLAGSIAIGEPRLVTSVRASAVLDLLAAGLWAVLAILCARAGSKRRSSSTTWSAAALALLALSALMRASSHPGDTSWLVGAAVLTAAAALVAVVNATTDVREALTSEGIALLTATGALAEAERLLEGVEARRQELVHDARSMIATLRAASTTLDVHAEQLDANTTRQLRAAMDDELERLGRLIGGSTGGPPRPFAVAAALGPVIATLRNEGLELEDRLDRSWAEGQPDDLAEVVHNLLANARRHAPGSRVRVRCQGAGDTVRIYIEDRGPGIPAEVMPRIFERGVSRCPGGGEGLGLHVAARLVRAQGGNLDASVRPGGGASFMVSLRAAPTPAIGRAGSLVAAEPIEDLFEVGQAQHPADDAAPHNVDPSRAPRGLGQLDDEPGTFRPGDPVADDSDIEWAATEGVAAVDDAVTVTGQGQSDGVRQQPRPDVNQRPANPPPSPSHHGDKHVTSGAAALRTS
jgi:two-component system, OmpR family, sensor kinase